MYHPNLNPIQKLLAEATRNLILQGAFGYDPEVGCEYETLDGKSCIAGLLFKQLAPDQTYTNLFGSAADVLTGRPELAETLAKALGTPLVHQAALTTLRMAQRVHDRAANYYRNGDLDMSELLSVAAHKVYRDTCCPDEQQGLADAWAAMQYGIACWSYGIHHTPA